MPARGTPGALTVVRRAPVGDVSIAPQLSITFSQPMVAVSAQAELASQAGPVKLTPQPPGRWRWLGTRTLLFEPTNRFPMATAYRVEVAAGTHSASAGTLATATAWRFSTPPPQLQTSYPQADATAQPRDPLLFVAFDQQIDPAAVLHKIKVQTGPVVWPLRLATDEEVTADKEVRQLASAAGAGRWLAFRVASKNDAAHKTALLPAGALVSVVIVPGTPSLEGPRLTTQPQSFTFRTHSTLRVVAHECNDYNDGGCTPDTAWDITFSNPLDAAALQPEQVHVAPPLADMQVEINDGTLIITGTKRGRTRYRVTLDRALKDTFGQTLGTDTNVVFNTRPALPSLNAAGGEFVVLDPSAPPLFSIFTVNQPRLRYKLYAVTPADWPRFAAYMRDRRGEYMGPPKLPGRLVTNKSIALPAHPDEMFETRLDLRTALTDGLGQALVLVEPSARARDADDAPLVAWVQRTNIGLDAFVDHAELRGWATSLKDGRPLADVRMRIEPADNSDGARSGADGLARLSLPDKSTPAPRLLVAQHGTEIAILPEHLYWWMNESSWQQAAPKDALRWYVFDDRGLYRPGEEVHVKGWVRHFMREQTGDISLLGEAGASVEYNLYDARSNKILSATLQLNALGGFDSTLKLPGTMNLGDATLVLGLPGRSADGERHVHQFQVQEFRRPEFEVGTEASQGPHIIGTGADVTASATYYAGGGLADAAVNWRVTATPASFTPPNRSEFTFGRWHAWWRDEADALANEETEESATGAQTVPQTQTFAGRTDAAGKHHLRIDFDAVTPARPTNVTVEANVTDVNRQAWTATTPLLVHPADVYVGLRSDSTFVARGTPLVVQGIVTDLDGNAVAGRTVRMHAARLDSVQEQGKWHERETDVQECAVASALTVVPCSFQTRTGGEYRVTATVADERGRVNESELMLWVAGGDEPPQRGLEEERVELIPDRREYAAGDTAQLLVRAPFYPATGLLTLRRNGIVASEEFALTEATTVLRVPIKDAYTPNLHAHVSLVGAAARTDAQAQTDPQLPKRPAYASGELNLSVPPRARKLTVKAVPGATTLEPGGRTDVNVEVRAANGEPVANSDVAVVVVDESVLALTDYKLGDPLALIYSALADGTSEHHLRDMLTLADPAALTAKVPPVPPGGAVLAGDGFFTYSRRSFGVGSSAGGGGRGSSVLMAMRTEVIASDMDATKVPMAFAKSASAARARPMATPARGQSAPAIRARMNFDALALFAASVPTDARGRATVTVQLPDNLSRYRVMAVAVAGAQQFGTHEASITARLPLMVRPSAPRFLNFGDHFELPVVVQNQTDAPLDVQLAVRATNAQLTDGAGRGVRVPANERVEVRLPVAAERAGTARFQVGAIAGAWTDAADISLPVWTPATTEAFATYGALDAGAIVQPVQPPRDVNPQFGGLEITTASTQLQELTDALLYLHAYPYECAEQLASRVLAVAALRDVLTEFQTKDLPPPAEIEATVARDLQRLAALQNYDGGFGFWRRGEKSWPYVSIHVAHALARAHAKGFAVPPEMTARAQYYLRGIEQRIPADYPIECRRALIAYALYVRQQLSERDAAQAREALRTAGVNGLSLEALGWLLPVLSGDSNSKLEVAAIRRYLNNHVTETAATAHFVNAYRDGAYLLLSSDQRADAVLLDALIGDQPQSDLIPKLVRGLLGGRKQGRWLNTQENVFALLALDRYFATYEKQTPDFTARTWLGSRFAGAQEFKGRTTDRQQLNIPMHVLTDNGAPTQDLTISKEGQGRLYYRIGLSYAPTSSQLSAADYGFTVARVYEAVDDAGDVRRDAAGAWRIKAGARVRVRLTMSAPALRYHVALVDPLPAGLEALNPALATTGSVPKDKQTAEPMRARWWWARTWYEQQNLRDERAEVFTTLLREGIYDYAYVARATVPGRYIVPPPKAEEMYNPETFGRGATDRVIIE